MNELMLDGKNMEREQIEEFLSRSGEDIERMEWLIGDVLNIARIESGAIRFNFRKADLAELARDVIRSYIEIARGKKIEISLNTESSATVFCDEKWISQAIGNLLKNAIDYSPEGGSVSVSISRSEAYAYLSVSDEGPGVSQEDSSKIFQSFYRGSSAGRSKKGSGLGLSLAKAIIERHQGDIKLKSSSERGSTFTIELPVRREE
jgi:signal transduction histidine kinase